MKRKTLIPALLTAVAVVILLSGCGKKTDGTAEPISTAMPDRLPPVDQAELAVPGVVADPSAELAALVDTSEVSTEPVEAPAQPETAPASEEPSAEPAAAEPTPEPSPEPTPKATPAPPPSIVTTPVTTAAPVEENTLRPGTYEGADGSVLTVEADGTCTFVTEVSGKINGKAMSADLTFHGTVENGEFSFDKVTYGAIDLTAIAAAAGYTDASPWEASAAIIYGAG